MRGTQLVPWLLIAAAPSLPLWLTPEPVAFKDFGTTEVAQLLTSLLLVALFLERALEVFVTTWRGPGAAELDRQVRQCADQKAQLEQRPEAQREALQSARDAAMAALEHAEQEKSQYKSQTQRIALWSGLTLGLLISAAGLRTLQALVDPEALSRLPKTQVVVFHLVDVLLTGGLIAGGSEGIHKLTQVYSNFMEATAQRAKGEAS